ncbi:MAG: ATP-binding protein [Elusimicrobiota bacterium]
MKFKRAIDPLLQQQLTKPGGIFLMGPRQVGKTTLILDVIGEKPFWHIRLQEYGLFQSYLKDPGLFKRQALLKLSGASPKKPLILFLDEAQKLPGILDDCQWILDEHKEKVRIFITGSSARKLRRHSTNLLPGRVNMKNLSPLLWQEISGHKHSQHIFDFSGTGKNMTVTWPFPWEDIFIYGSLPGILTLPEKERTQMLSSYALGYLKEEIQAEALTRSLDGFSRFLELAALESGQTTNFQKLSREVGLSLNTIKTYYLLLIDTLVAIALPAYSRNTRKKVTTTSKIYFFDVGVRNAAAELPISKDLLKVDPGKLFEHGIVLEFLRRIDYFSPTTKAYFWRDDSGAEVDFLIDTKEKLIPIEIKWTSKTTNLKLKGLKKFMSEYNVPIGYVIGNFPQAEQIEKNIIALPWWSV